MGKKAKKHLTANGIFIREGRALLFKRNSKKYYAGLWDIPGGHIKKSEEPEAALRREMQEELGVIPHEFSLFRVYDETDPTSGEQSRHYVYLVHAWEGEPQNLEPREHSQMGWFSLAELEGLEVTPSTRAELAELLRPAP